MRSFSLKESELILLVLLTEKPSYGYELIRLLQSTLLRKCISPSAVYYNLKNLETKQLIRARLRPGTFYSTRKVYSLIPNARHYLRLVDFDSIVKNKQLRLVQQFTDYLQARDRLVETEQSLLKLSRAVGNQFHKRLE